MALETYANAPVLSTPTAAWTTLNGAILAGDTSLIVASFAAFPSSGQYRILIGDELMIVTAGQGSLTWTVTRGAEGTTAAGHANGASVFHTLTAASLLRSPGALTTTGDIPYLASTGAPTRLGAGADGTYLRYASSLPTASALLATDLTAIPGATTQVFFNDGGAWGANAGFTFVKGASATLRVANGTNPEVGAIGWSGNNFRVGTIGGTTGGTARDTILGSAAGAVNGIYFATEDTSRWNVNPTGHLVPFATATYDLGDASHVLRNVYAVLTNATGLPISTGVSGLGTNVATFLATPSSANLAAAITNETGTGVLVFNDTPTILTPTIASLVNATHTHQNVAGGGTLDAAAIAAGTLAAARGGTGVSNTGTITLGGNLTTSGAFATTFTMTAATGVTFPTTGTLATLAGSEALTNKTLNGNTFTAGTYTLTGVAGKVLTFNKSLTLEGTDSTTMTFPTTSATIARTDAAQTFTGSQTIAALVGPVTITEAVGSSGLTITGATQVTSFPALSLTQTWNASGTAFSALKLNVTNTASAATSRLLDLQIGGVAYFFTDRVGNVGMNFPANFTGAKCWMFEAATGGFQLRRWSDNFGSATASIFQVINSVATDTLQLDGGALALGTATPLYWSSDLILRRGGAAATLQLGADVNGAAVNQTLWSCSGITGSDKTGSNFTIASGKGTGAGAVSSLIFQTPTVLGSGTTAQSLATRLTLDSANATFAVPVKLSNAAVTGLTPGVLAASTNASIVLVDSGGQAYRVPCVI